MLNISSPVGEGFDCESILAEIRRGNPAAETALVKQFSRGLLLMLTQRCGDMELAADIHQDTFAVVFSRLREKPLENPKKIKAFIHTTAVNLFINHYRKEQRHNTGYDEEALSNACAPDADQLRRLQSEQTAELVRNLISELPARRDRKILWYYYIEEQDKARICERLDLQPAHFDRVLYRAKQRIRQKLELSAREDRLPGR